jgi:hypothetical protein
MFLEKLWSVPVAVDRGARLVGFGIASGAAAVQAAGSAPAQGSEPGGGRARSVPACLGEKKYTDAEPLLKEGCDPEFKLDQSLNPVRDAGIAGKLPSPARTFRHRRYAREIVKPRTLHNR